MIPALYRGDSLPAIVRATADPLHRGRTFADYFITEGLMAKSADGGRGEDLSKPHEYIFLSHIGYLSNTPEQRISYHSPMLSFSSDIDSANYFKDRTEKKQFSNCELREATHFIWKILIKDVKEIKNGLYEFTYKASTKNVEKFKISNPTNDNLIEAIAESIVHQHIEEDVSTHVAWLYDAVTFIQKNNFTAYDQALVSRALQRAQDSSEWLLYPRSPMPDGRGFSARFTLNEQLYVEQFCKEEK